jgi:hypothetical protein
MALQILPSTLLAGVAGFDRLESRSLRHISHSE